MAHTYMLFDFGTDEEKAQQARHKLEGWKQAFRLDKKLQYKLERDEPESAATPAAAPEAAAEKAEAPSKSKSAKSKSKPAAKSKAKTGKSEASESAAAAPPSNAKVHLFVRLYFSGHEKLTEQRWLDRIPAEEPFKDASPRVVKQGEPQFEEVVSQFDSLE